MINRFWDKKNQYTHGFLKEYDHWILEVNYRQSTLGCFIVFAKRELARTSQLYTSEIIQLKEVMGEMENALSAADEFKPDWYNYYQMGNGLHNLHFHGIPRYKASRFFNDREWVDGRWGDLVAWTDVDSSHDLVAKIREAIKPYLL